MSIKCDGSSSGALWFRMVCSQSSGAHQHTSCAPTTKTQATAPRRMSPDAVSRADACPAPVFTSVSPSLLPLSLLSPCHRHRSLCYHCPPAGKLCNTHRHAHAHTHTQLVWLCPTFHRCQENNSQRDNSQHLQHDHDEAGREEDNLLSPPSMAASLILTPSLSLYLPAHLSLTHSLPPPRFLSYRLFPPTLCLSTFSPSHAQPSSLPHPGFLSRSSHLSLVPLCVSKLDISSFVVSLVSTRTETDLMTTLSFSFYLSLISSGPY